jgi:hypothetical protein
VEKMSKGKLAAAEPGKQIALFEIEAPGVPANRPRDAQSTKPRRKPAKKQYGTLPVNPVAATSAVPDAPHESELTSWLAKFMAKSALAEAQREMATNAQAEPRDDGECL